MITLNDYLYSGDTVLKILHQYEADLRKETAITGSRIDLAHCNLLRRLTELLEHNDFLTAQSQRIREYYKFMAKEYPFLAFTFKGRIKSLIRAEEKFNGYVVETISDYYREHGELPDADVLEKRLSLFRDLIAYRIVISMPRCHLKPGEDRDEVEIRYLYQIANQLLPFMEERGFTAEYDSDSFSENSPLDPAVRPYYRDYVIDRKDSGYQSLHITFFDNIARCHTELQLRTKRMDDMATIGTANHRGYEQLQQRERTRREDIPVGLSREFDEAWSRQNALQQLDFSKLDVNMFSAYSAELINDGCGLYRGRLITPFEHLSRFQNDIID